MSSEVAMVSGRPAPQKMMDEEPDQLKNEILGNLMCPHGLAAVLSVVFPCSWICGGCTMVETKNEKVLTSTGQYLGTLREPGCYCVNPCLLNARTVNTAQVAVDLKDIKVADAKGNPLILSGVVTYRVVDSKKAVIDVTDYPNFLATKGTTVLKQVASMYPYEGKGDEQSLKSEAEHLRIQLRDMLQERVNDAGLQVISFELNDLSYAPEIAQQMLVRQQAEAVVDARKVVAHGAVEITHEMLKGLAKKGIEFDDRQKAQLAANLCVIICGEQKATATLDVGNRNNY